MNTSAMELTLVMLIHSSEQRLPQIIFSQTHARKPIMTYTNP